PQSETVFRERYTLGNKMKFYVSSVALGIRGPEIILSRKDKRMVSFVFEQEIPEITSGEVVIKGIARDPGNRSKVAVATDDESIDPIGSCVGQRGSRITTIIDELAGEKIDVILYNENAADYIKAALSPAKVASVELDEADKQAIVKVESDQFSLAIGRGGQNVRLAAELTGWKIKVVEKDGTQVVTSEDGEVVVEGAPEKAVEAGESTPGTEEVVVEEVKVEETEKSAESPAEEVSEEKTKE
ncbi:MAG: KH domain-containing protein, partial [Candidatus Magasanikbacteria bacterium]|nr:KH domain-containing protein [Candidatus Magasanikbacteria bacterium]